MKATTKITLALIQILFVFATLPNAVAKQKDTDWDYADLISKKEKMEGEVCLTCATEQRGSLSKLTVESEKIDVEAMKRHLERQKERQIRKITNQECPSSQGPEFGDDMGLEMSAMDLDSGRDFKPDFSSGLKNRRPGKSSNSRSGKSKDNDIQTQMLALDPEYMDDIQDAIDEKTEKCKREARSKKSNSMQAQTMNPNLNSALVQGMNTGMYRGYSNSMMAPQPMMGNYSSMNPYQSMMGNYSSMNPYQSMMGSYSSMNSFPSLSSYASMNPYQTFGTAASTQSYMGQQMNPYAQMGWR